MNDEQTPINEKIPVDRETSDIGKSGINISDLAWYIGGSALVIAILWLNFGSGFSENSENKNIVQKQEEQYRIVGNNREPFIPEAEIPIPHQQSNSQPVGDPMIVHYQIKMQELERKKVEAEKKLAEARKRSPIMVYSKEPSGNINNAYSNSSNGNDATLFNNNDHSINLDENLNNIGGIATVQSGRLRNQNWMIAQGTTIRGVLESAIQSDIAGYIRAIVSSDIYSFDGSQVLIQRWYPKFRPGAKVLFRLKKDRINE